MQLSISMSNLNFYDLEIILPYQIILEKTNLILYKSYKAHKILSLYWVYKRFQCAEIWPCSTIESYLMSRLSEFNWLNT